MPPPVPWYEMVRGKVIFTNEKPTVQSEVIAPVLYVFPVKDPAGQVPVIVDES